MPLLEVVGVTSTNLTFSVAFAFFDSEKEDNYVWTLQSLKHILDPEVTPSVIVTNRKVSLMNALKHVFPTSQNLLCRFHILRNVASKCKKNFYDGKVWENLIERFNEVVASSTEVEYSSTLEEFQIEFVDYPDAVLHVVKNWLNLYKEQFIAAWTDRYTHLGNTTTNRAEGAHSKLKKNLGSSRGNLSSSWNAIHQMLLTEHVEIKASFERSLLLLKHEFKGRLYDELRGFVSKAALDLIFVQVKKTEKIAPSDKVACGCQIRLTHGLPCVCEIASYKLQSRPIPLSCINEHWKKLSDQPNGSPKIDLHYDQDIELFKKVFDSTDEGKRINLLRKLKEVANPSATLLLEPQIKKKTRGQPKTAESKRQLKLKSSTRRDPSTFDYALRYVQTQESQNIPKKKLQSERGKKKGDGNCGYRVVADFLYGDEEKWPTVSHQLISELQLNMELYISVFGSVDRYNELYQSLPCIESPAPTSFWMTMPEMGHVIASRYNIPLVYISPQLSVTMLPLRSYPLVEEPKVVAIVFVDNNHFIRLKMNNDRPFPPINIYWSRYRSNLATRWGELYTDQLERYRHMTGQTTSSS